MTENTPNELIKSLPNRCAENEATRAYVGWGPYEDYLWNESKGWAGRMVFDTWTDFHANMANCDDDLNLIIDFYFDVSHESKPCKACGESGYNPGTKHISDTFYDFERTGQRWCDKITQDEVQALVDANRLWDFTREIVDGKWCEKDPPVVPSAAEVNAANARGAPGLRSHDAINRWILIKTRAKRLDVWGYCEECQGDGTIRLSLDRIELNLWLAHPRKGATRGVHVKEVLETDLQQVRAFLKRSWRKHQEHFGQLYT